MSLTQSLQPCILTFTTLCMHTYPLKMNLIYHVKNITYLSFPVKYTFTLLCSNCQQLKNILRNSVNNTEQINICTRISKLSHDVALSVVLSYLTNQSIPQAKYIHHNRQQCHWLHLVSQNQESNSNRIMEI